MCVSVLQAYDERADIEESEDTDVEQRGDDRAGGGQAPARHGRQRPLRSLRQVPPRQREVQEQGAYKSLCLYFHSVLELNSAHLSNIHVMKYDQKLL